MKITFLGHAGLFIETAAGSILCDPWFNPAYFGAWFPFPSNEAIDPALVANPDFLYISHEHRDHLDRRFLIEHVNKSATVLLPDYPTRSLERELRDIGFTSFLRTRNGEPVTADGLRIAIFALVAPSDGPEGDSGLVVDDGVHRLFNQNDSRPADMEVLQGLGPFDAHFLQFSGAIWYPMVYRFPDATRAGLGARKRLNQQERALAFIRQVDARFVFPSAGPPCFLDEDLYHLNDFEHDPTNIFCDQSAFLGHMRAQGEARGRLVIPGTVVELQAGGCTVAHPVAQDEVEAIFTDKRAYLDAYRARKAAVIAAERASWPSGTTNLLASLRARIEPLLSIADLTCAGIDGRVLFDCGTARIVIDFISRRVYAWDGESCSLRFRVDPRLLEHCILYEDDWVNSLFLSCRFEAERDGPYNEYVYNFFKCLNLERLQYAEGYYAGESGSDELVRMGDYMVQRRCPHLKADLTRFGRLEDGILTCSMHGWQFDVATGECLTSPDRRLYTRRVDADSEPCRDLCDEPERPELAVVVLSLGAPPELRAAVDSLLRQPVPLEIVVVNSGGGDADAALAEIDASIGSGIHSGVGVISATERLWPGAARNVGIRATQAPWIAFLASDHIAAPGWAERRLARHRAGHRAVASAVVNSHPRNPFAWTSHAALLVRRLPGVPPEEAGLYGVSYARALFDTHGPFREDLRIGEDTEYNARLSARDQPVWAPEIHAIHRNPTRLGQLINDQYARGRRSALHWPRRLKSRLARRTLTRFRWTAGLAWRSVRGPERVMLVLCLPLLFIAVLAHEFGVRAGVRERSACAGDAAATPQERPDASVPR